MIQDLRKPRDSLRSRRRGFAASETGVMAIEFSLVAPLFLLLLAGVVNYGEALQAQTAIGRLAGQIAYSWAQCQNSLSARGCRADMQNYATAIPNVAPMLNPDNLKVRLIEAKLQNGALTTLNSSGALSPTLTAALMATLSDGQSGVGVEISYQCTYLLFGGQGAWMPLFKPPLLVRTIAEVEG